MRRLFVATMICSGFLLLAGVAVAGASPSQTMHKDGGASAAAAPTLAGQRATSGSWTSQKPRFIPAPEALASAAAAINGTIRDYYGSGLAYADVSWHIGSDTGGGPTDSAGAYSFSDIPAAAGNGEITALSSDENTWLDWWNLTWSSPGPTTFDMQPGAVSLEGSTGGPWGQWADSLSTDVYTSSGMEGKDAYQYFPGSLSVSAPVLPGTIEGMGVYFFNDEGAEVTDFNGQTLGAGGTIPMSATVDEYSAQRIWTGTSKWNGPWGSGRPGSKLKVWLQNYPTTWVNSITGFSENPANSAFKNFGNFRSLSTTRHSRTLAVPAKAVPGYGYRVHLGHTQGPLDLSTWFQICTLNATKTTVNKGTAIRFSGVVPVQGHRGSTAGKRTTVDMYVHKGTAAQPTVMDPRKQGWQLVGSFRTDGYGKYRTPLLKPRLTLSVVMLYPGDDWYWSGYTSPRKITVR